MFLRSKICLSKYICIEFEGDDFLDELCHYFARLIFSVVGKELDEEIPLDLIKEAIIHVDFKIKFDYYLGELRKSTINNVLWS